MREVTFDLVGLGEGSLETATEAVGSADVKLTRAASVAFPFRKAHVSVEGSDPAIDAAYEALRAAFPDVVIEVREKEFPWHWEAK